MAKLKNSIKNIEGIIKELKKKTKSLKSLTKLDGITIECTVFKNSDVDSIIKEIKEISLVLLLVLNMIQIEQQILH